MRTLYLTAAREYYGKHLDDLSDDQIGRLDELIALASLENDRRNK